MQAQIINMQVNSAGGRGGGTTCCENRTKQGTDERERWNRTERGQKWMNKSGGERRRPAVLFVGRLGPPCASLSEKLRYPSGLPLSVAWQQVHRGSLFKNQASPTAGTAPDKKDPLWRGFLGSQTSAGKRLWRTNERFCGRGRAGHGGQVDGQRKREREGT